MTKSCGKYTPTFGLQRVLICLGYGVVYSMNNLERKNQSKLKYEGLIVNTKNYGKAVVTCYINKKMVDVMFLNTKNRDYFWMKDIIKGNIRDNCAKSTLGVGVKGSVSSMCVTGEKHPLYIKWSDMLARCYGAKNKDNYLDCRVDEDFLDYSKFYAWCENQTGHNHNTWCLDKDILVKGNKIYSPETCCFVPHEINTLILNCKKSRGSLPVGVSKTSCGKRYRVRLHIFGKATYLGTYSDDKEAFQVYKVAKQDYIKEVANKWKDQIDSRVYAALINWEISIND